jgi:hypothetical protein
MNKKHIKYLRIKLKHIFLYYFNKIFINFAKTTIIVFLSSSVVPLFYLYINGYISTDLSFNNNRNSIDAKYILIFMFLNISLTGYSIVSYFSIDRILMKDANYKIVFSKKLIYKDNLKNMIYMIISNLSRNNGTIQNNLVYIRLFKTYNILKYFDNLDIIKRTKSNTKDILIENKFLNELDFTIKYEVYMNLTKTDDEEIKYNSLQMLKIIKEIEETNNNK